MHTHAIITHQHFPDMYDDGVDVDDILSSVPSFPSILGPGLCFHLTCSLPE